MPPILASLGAKSAAIFAGLTFRLILIGIIVAMFVNTYVDVRIPLPIVPDIHWRGWKPEALESREAIKGFAKAQEQARKAAEAALKAKEAEYRDKARKADDDYEADRARMDSATDRYIASHRMREGSSCPTGGTTTVLESGSAGLPKGMPPDDFVVVRESDVRACSALYRYALGAHNWAMRLGE